MGLQKKREERMVARAERRVAVKRKKIMGRRKRGGERPVRVVSVRSREDLAR